MTFVLFERRKFPLVITTLSGMGINFNALFDFIPIAFIGFVNKIMSTNSKDFIFNFFI
jgi:hypothetical protein